MIESYGIHWHAERVEWGRYGVPGTLLGAKTRSAKAKTVDFRYQRGIYALYADYDLVYVGQTGGAEADRLFRRLRAHRNDHLSERWNRFSWFGTQWVTKTGNLSIEAARVSNSVASSLNVLEAVSIALAEPKLNLQRGKWGDATKYFQWWNRTDDYSEEG